MRKIAVSALCLIATLTAVHAQKKCRALVMSGGANKGAYEAGVVHGLSHLLENDDAHYDVVSGVSAGALNSAAIVMWPKDKPKEMSEWLVDFWRKTTSDMIFQNWPNGYQEGLFQESGLFDTTPLLNTLTNTMAELGGVPKRKIVVSAVDVNNGEYVTYTEANSKPEELPQRALASASIPFVFPHQHIGDRILMDGGTVWNTNLVSAVERCKEIVDKDEDIIMDVVICSDDKLEKINSTGNSIANFLRYWGVSGYQKSMRDVSEFLKARPNVQYRYFFMASKPLTWGLQEMDFSPAVIEPMIQIGMDDAAYIVANTKPGESFDKVRQWNNDKSEVKAKFTHLSDYLYSKEQTD